ncbi:hypothetical protein [Streptococcus suis]|uniref:hypothetical protein n=1 Tax=Streptococcus suis TaxID=1307 RepID=UPI00240EEBFE|nr:hypothetical protein [Streptococcus suis]MDG3137300.1 hypothetical protein [Streptococcus suis]
MSKKLTKQEIEQELNKTRQRAAELETQLIEAVASEQNVIEQKRSNLPDVVKRLDKLLGKDGDNSLDTLKGISNLDMDVIASSPDAVILIQNQVIISLTETVRDLAEIIGKG